MNEWIPLPSLTRAQTANTPLDWQGWSKNSYTSHTVLWQQNSVKWASARKGLTHWGRVTHIWVSEIIIIASDNGLSPGRCQAIIWTNAWILLTGPLATNFSEISIGIKIFSFKKMHLKMSSAKWRPFCLGLNVLRPILWQWQPCNDSDEIRYW